jgi:hypothetical protein
MGSLENSNWDEGFGIRTPARPEITSQRSYGSLSCRGSQRDDSQRDWSVYYAITVGNICATLRLPAKEEECRLPAINDGGGHLARRAGKDQNDKLLRSRTCPYQ